MLVKISIIFFLSLHSLSHAPSLTEFFMNFSKENLVFTLLTRVKEDEDQMIKSWDREYHQKIYCQIILYLIFLQLGENSNFRMDRSKFCGCKGVRTCLLCEDKYDLKGSQHLITELVSSTHFVKHLKWYNMKFILFSVLQIKIYLFLRKIHLSM